MRNDALFRCRRRRRRASVCYVMMNDIWPSHQQRTHICGALLNLEQNANIVRAQSLLGNARAAACGHFICNVYVLGPL